MPLVSLNQRRGGWTSPHWQLRDGVLEIKGLAQGHQGGSGREEN